MLALAKAAAAARGHAYEDPHVGKMTLRVAGLFVPEAREAIEMAYEFEEPYILDDSAIRAAYGLTHTPLDEWIPATVAWFAEEAREEEERVA